MKKIVLFVVLSQISYTLLSQVGIGNTNPNATLDISASNVATPANNDGILIPRIDSFPATSPTAAQQGMLVYLTTASGGNPPGFYYWDNNAGPASWVSVGGSGAQKIDDLTDGKSDNDGTQNGSSIFLGVDAGVADDGSDNRNVGIGFESMNATTTGPENTAIGFQTLFSNTSGIGNASFGFQSLFSNLGGDYNSAIGYQALYSNRGDYNVANGYQALFSNFSGSQNIALGDQSLYSNSAGIGSIAIGEESLFSLVGGGRNIAIGNRALFLSTLGLYNIAIGSNSGRSSTGNYNVYLGRQAGYFHTGSNTLWIENTSADENGALIYGEFDNDILRTNGQFQIGNPTGTGYAFPTVDGSSGQILTTDGAGQISFATPSTGAEKIDDLTDGKSDNDGTNNGSSIFLGVGAGANDDGTDNQNVGVGFEALNSNTQGFWNIALGYQSQRDNIDGNANISLGWVSLQKNIDGYSNLALGHQALQNNTSGFYNIGIGTYSLLKNQTGNLNLAIGAYSLFENLTGVNNTAFGIDSGRNSLGNSNVFIGYRSGYNVASDNKLYIENSNADENGALIYGEFDTNILRTNSEFQIGNPTGTGYAFPTVDGTSGYILQTNGTGQLSFVDPSAISDDDWVVSGGNVLRNTGNVLVNRANQNYKFSAGGYSVASTESSVDIAPSSSFGDAMVITTNYGVSNGLSVSQNSGSTTGTRSSISTYNNRGEMTANLGYYSNVPSNRAAGLYVTNPGSMTNTYGVLYEVSQANNVGGDRYGLVVDLDIDGSGSTYYGIKSDVGGTRTSTKYGVYTKVTAPGSVGYGLYSDVQSGDDYAAYFIGRTSLGDGTTNRYLMPSADGTNGQILTTDGSGVTNWEDSPSNFALAKMRLTSSQTIPSLSWTKMNFDATTFDLGSNFNTTTDRFEVTEDGYYSIEANIISTINNTSSDSFVVAIHVNGTPVKYERRDHHGSGYVSRLVSTIELLSAGDYIEVYMLAYSSISITSDIRYTTFEVERIR